MSDFIMLTGKSCPNCALSKKVIQNLNTQSAKDVQYVDFSSAYGQQLVIKHNIMTIPAFFVREEFIGNDVGQFLNELM